MTLKTGTIVGVNEVKREESQQVEDPRTDEHVFAVVKRQWSASPRCAIAVWP
jgi:hypothetical protein